MECYRDNRGQLVEVPEKYAFIRGDKFCVIFKDGTERIFKHIYGGIGDLCGMLDLDTVEDIGDI